MASSHKMASKDRRRNKAKLFGGLPLQPCAFCGVWLTYSAAVLDHKVPAIFGGSNRFENLQLACKLCNDSRRHSSIDAYRQRLALECVA